MTQRSPSIAPVEFRDPVEAASYLASFSGLPGSPEPRGWRDVMTGRHVVRAMQLMPRHQRYADGTFQTNAEHSQILAHMCVQFAGSQRDDLDPWLVQAMSLGHDLKEVHCGDTPIRDEVLKKTKKPREAAGHLITIARDFGNNPFMQGVLLAYEDCKISEAKFVYAMDKYEPLEFDLENEGETYRYHGDDFPTLVRTQLPRTFIDKHVFHMVVTSFVDIGERWEEWKCKPFDGDPKEIVYDVRDQLVRQDHTS